MTDIIFLVSECHNSRGFTTQDRQISPMQILNSSLTYYYLFSLVKSPLSRPNQQTIRLVSDTIIKFKLEEGSIFWGVLWILPSDILRLYSAYIIDTILLITTKWSHYSIVFIQDYYLLLIVHVQVIYNLIQFTVIIYVKNI